MAAPKSAKAVILAFSFTLTFFQLTGPILRACARLTAAPAKDRIGSMAILRGVVVDGARQPKIIV